MNIDLTETEVIHIMDSLRMRINDLRGEAGRCGFEESADLADELEELEHDLFEASARAEEPALDGRSFSVAESDFIDHGVRAREMMKAEKASSRAAARRNFNMKVKDERLSKTQTHDVWDANDPKNW